MIVINLKTSPIHLMFSGVAASLRSSKTILCRQPAWLLWTPKKLSHSGFLKQQFWNHPLQVSYMFGDMSEYVLIKLKHDWSYGYSTIHGSETPRLSRLRSFQDSRDSQDFWVSWGSKTPDILREHDATHWWKTVNFWDISLLRVELQKNARFCTGGGMQENSFSLFVSCSRVSGGE